MASRACFLRATKDLPALGLRAGDELQFTTEPPFSPRILPVAPPAPAAVLAALEAGQLTPQGTQYERDRAILRDTMAKMEALLAQRVGTPDQRATARERITRWQHQLDTQLVATPAEIRAALEAAASPP